MEKKYERLYDLTEGEIDFLDTYFCDNYVNHELLAEAEKSPKAEKFNDLLSALRKACDESTSFDFSFG